MMDDLISRRAAIEAIEKLILPQVVGETDAEKLNRIAWRWAINCAEEMIGHLPSEQPEPLTKKEQRVFLAAMAREEKVCKQMDDDCRNCREPYEDSLVRICHEITRKVKGALWI